MRNKPSKGELIAPAGSFSAGIYAFRSGANAVYLGLTSFSARKGAKNFTLDEFSRLKALAEGLGKRVYAALNTVIRDDEMPRAAALLYDLEALEADGIIIQDLGLLGVIRKNFPLLSIHASTQMGVHNSSGIEFLKTLGVRRVILSRELTLEEIARIRTAHPDMELEVFIHGALCYSFSGLCLASGLLLGRSGNRGECAQICRGWFEADPEDPPAVLPRRGYYFSCNDLAAGEDIRRLRDIGVDSFKIEGRMKPPEWTAAVSAYYRAVLDGRSAREAAAHAEAARLIFSRRQTGGYIKDPQGKNLLNSGYPGHLGIPAGRVPALRPGAFLLRLKTDLALRDGLLFFRPAGDGGSPAGGGGLPRPVQFGITAFEVRGKRAVSARAGEEAWITCTETPPAGAEVYKVSSHKSALPEINEPLPRKTLPVRITAEADGAGISLTLGPLNGMFPAVTRRLTAAPQPARSNQPFEDILRRYCSPPGDSRFSAAEIAFENRTDLPEDGIFINPSILKELRRRACAALEASYNAGREDRVRKAVFTPPQPDERYPLSCDAALQSDRSLPVTTQPRRDEIMDPASGLPFIADPVNLKIGALPRPTGSNRVFLSLCPVLFDGTMYFSALEKALRIALKKDPGLRVTIGLGNPGHLTFALSLEGIENVDFFADYGLYIANRRALELLKQSVPRLRFYYPWIEEPAALTAMDEADTPAGEYGTFEPPLFISRACVWKHGGPTAAGGPKASGIAPDACKECGGRRAVVRQGKRSFLLRPARIGGECLNLLFRKP